RRQRTDVNLNGRLRTTPSRGFEDCRVGVQSRPLTSAEDRSDASVVRDRAPTSKWIRRLGCHLGCHEAALERKLTQSILPGAATHSHFCPVTEAMRSKSAS